MKKFILSIIICFGVLYSWSVMAQENAFVFQAALHPEVSFINVRALVYMIFTIILFLSFIGLFFKKIRKVCKWILIIGTILLALVIVADNVVNHILYQEYLQSLNESTITEEA